MVVSLLLIRKFRKVLESKFFASSNERWAIAPDIKHQLFASALVDYERMVAQTETQLMQTQSRLWALRIIRNSLRGALEATQ